MSTGTPTGTPFTLRRSAARMSGVPVFARQSANSLIALCVTMAGCVGTSEEAIAQRASNHQSSGGDLRVAVEGDRLSISARDIRLDRLLEAISAQSGLSIEMEGRLDERVAIEIHELPMARAIARILQSYSYTLRYAPPTSEESSRLWVHSDDALNDETRRTVFPYPGRGTPVTQESEQDIRRLSAVLTQGDTADRAEAVMALSDVGGSEGAAALSAAALNDGNPLIREEAIYALTALGGDMTPQTLEQALTDPDESVRRAAIDAFAEIGGEASALSLAFALNDESPSLRADALNALAHIGGEAAMVVLEQALADQDDTIREAAADYLIELAPGRR